MHCSSWQATEPSKETIVSEIHSHLIAPPQRHYPDDPLTILPSYYPLKLRRQCSSIFIDGLLLRKNDPTSAVGTRLVNIIVQKSNVIHTVFPRKDDDGRGRGKRRSRYVRREDDAKANPIGKIRMGYAKI